MECPICGRFYIDLETGFDVDEVCPFHTEEEVEDYLHGSDDDGMNPDGWREPDEEDDEEGLPEIEVG